MNTLAVSKEALRLVWREHRAYLPVVIVQGLFNNLAPYVTLFLSGLIVNELAGTRNARALLALVIVAVTANAVIGAVNILLNAAFNIQEKKFGLHEDAMFNEKVLRLDYINLENPNIRDMRQRIDANRRINMYGIWLFLRMSKVTINNVLNLFLAIGFSVGVFVTAYKDPSRVLGLVWFPAGLVLLIAVYAVITGKQTKNFLKIGHDVSEDMLKINRIGSGFRAYQMGKDVRLFQLRPIFENIDKELLKLNRHGFERESKLEFQYSIPTGIINQGIAGLIYAFVCLNALIGIFGAGYVLTFAGYVSRLTQSINTLFTMAYNLKYNTPYLQLYLDFFAIENTMYRGAIPVEKRSDNRYSIEFINVSFRYPGSELYALKNLNLRLTIGEKLAVVGMNGSGKTTMIKLLCRLYDPTEGIITLNGIDIKKYDYTEYMNLFSVVFQDFHLFSFQLGQNVASSEDADSSLAEECLAKAGFSDRLQTLPQGLHTPLYKDFDEDGVEISGGEAQMIALARALYKDAPFIVLDEPTAALDPIAEYGVYSRFDEIVGGKTAIYISHRLSSCRFCQDIAVFHLGELIQRGSHETLLADENGKYYELWHAQAQYYEEKSVESIDSTAALAIAR